MWDMCFFFHNFTRFAVNFRKSNIFLQQESKTRRDKDLLYWGFAKKSERIDQMLFFYRRNR